MQKDVNMLGQWSTLITVRLIDQKSKHQLKVGHLPNEYSPCSTLNLCVHVRTHTHTHRVGYELLIRQRQPVKESLS